jgi:hypothetical protein
VAGRDPVGKRQADLIMRAYPWLSQRLELDVEGRVAYLDRCLKVLSTSEGAWVEFARLCKDGNLDKTQQAVVRTHLSSLTRTFNQHPDFVARLVDDLVAVQPDASEKIKLYESVVSLFEKTGRADLACAARLKITDLWCAQEKWPTAGKGLISTIRKFPKEGRYVPRMTTKLQEVAGHYKEGPNALGQLYVELVPTMIVYYGKEGSEYCGKLFDQASTYLRENKLDKHATTLKVKSDQARQSATR